MDFSLPLKEKWKYVFENMMLADMKLKVGSEEEEFPCHQLILAMNSPVFETMLSQRWKTDSSETVIKLPEANSVVMKIILKFLYTEEFNISESLINPLEVCLSILEFSSVYFILPLKEICVDYLINTEGLLNADNAVQVFVEAVRLSEDKLETAVLQIISKNPSVLSTSSFLRIPQPCLCRYLKSDSYISINEIDLFDIVCLWADMQCSFSGLNPTPENMRAALKDALYLIRFPVMDPNAFISHVTETGILSMEERIEVLTYFCLEPEDRYPICKLEYFNTKPRLFWDNTFTLQRFRTVTIGEFDYGSSFRNFIFEVDRPITIKSLGFYGPGIVTTPTFYLVTLNLSEKEAHDDWRRYKVCASVCHESAVVHSGSSIFHVELPNNRIEPKKEYFLSFMLEGPKTKNGVLEDDEVEMDCDHLGKILFKFSGAKYKNNRCQVPEIRFSLRE